jgi:hypothetical protein
VKLLALGALALIPLAPMCGGGPQKMICADPTVVRGRQELDCEPAGARIIRTVPDTWTLRNALYLALEYGGGRVIACENGVAVVVSR